MPRPPWLYGFLGGGLSGAPQMSAFTDQGKLNFLRPLSAHKLVILTGGFTLMKDDKTPSPYQ